MHRDHMYTDEIIYEAREIQIDESTCAYVLDESALGFSTLYLHYVAYKCKKIID